MVPHTSKIAEPGISTKLIGIAFLEYLFLVYTQYATWCMMIDQFHTRTAILAWKLRPGINLFRASIANPIYQAGVLVQFNLRCLDKDSPRHAWKENERRTWAKEVIGKRRKHMGETAITIFYTNIFGLDFKPWKPSAHVRVQSPNYVRHQHHHLATGGERHKVDTRIWPN